MSLLQKQVYDKYRKYESSNPVKQNTCNITGSIKLTNMQKFVSEYVINNINNKDGLFLYHTVGAGKTLTGVNLMKHFEEKGYSLLWITRTTLRKDLEKALDIIHLKKPPIVFSYKQFSNVCKGRGENYKKLLLQSQKKGGKDDVLYKTLIVIDEAHKLYTKDLKPQEMHDIKVIQDTIFNSYKISDKPCKLILMSATPITKEPEEVIKLINLLKSKESERLSLNIHKYFSDNKFNKIFQNKIQGMFSYINTAGDYSKFATSKIYYIPVEISDPVKINKSDCDKEYKNCMKSFLRYECIEQYDVCMGKHNGKYHKIGQKKLLNDKCSVKL